MKEETIEQAIDIREDYLLKKDNLLDILLQDKTSAKNIILATDSYENNGISFAPGTCITANLVTAEYDAQLV